MEQNMTADVLPMSALTEANACVQAREFNMELSKKVESENYWRSVVAKNAIVAALRYNERNPKNVMQYMQTRYPECGFKNYQQKQAQLIWDHRRVMRYLKSENRVPSFPGKRTVNIGGKEITVRPDVAFVLNKDTIELVLFSIGKPTMTNGGKNRQFKKEMQLYALHLYARQLGYKNITASFYFLKKNTDLGMWNLCDPFFFGNGGNVVQIQDIYDPDAEVNELDEKMEKDIELFRNGIEEEKLCAGTCEQCRNYDICKYTLPPKEMETEDEGGQVTAAKAVNVKFSDEQLEAVNFDDGVCRIIAGAGSGKTKTVVGRVVRLLKSGVKPEEILMITFTKNGAAEMLSRIESEMGHSVPGLMISTFNAFENLIVANEWKSLGFKKAPTLIDDVLNYPVIARLLNENPIYEWTGRCFLNFSSTSRGFGGRGALAVAGSVFSAVKKARAAGEDPVGAARDTATMDEINQVALTKLVRLYDKYDEFMKENGLIDYEDQELKTFEVLKNDPDYMDKNFLFRHVIIDEFQDSSEAQIDLIRVLRHMKSNRSVMVVGDDDQSIYGFRDTTPEYILRFEQYIGEPVTDIYLTKNYRSTPQICGFASKVVSLNRDKTDKELVPVRPDGMPVIVNGFKKADKEYEFIAENILLHIKNGTSLEDIAVMAYTKRELRKIADVLTKAGIPSMFGAPEPLMENSRIKAVLAFAKLLMDPSSAADAAVCANALVGGGFMKLPPEKREALLGEMAERVEAVRGAFEEEKKSMLLKFIEEISFGDEAIEYFSEQLEQKTYDEILDYLRDFSLYGDGMEYRRTRKYPGVLLITAHSSKGLEWPLVYNTISKYPMPANWMGMEESRRLFFVSATRARDELYVTGVFDTGTKDRPRPNVLLAEAYDAVGLTFPET